MTAIGILAALAAATLLYSGIKGYNPASFFTSVFTGQEPTKLAGLSDTVASVVDTGLGLIDTSGTCNDAVPTVTYSNGTPGGVKLQPSAMDAFKRAEERAGRKIILTGSWRSCAVQVASHASNPERFASPGSSYHPKGLAIDVNMTNSYSKAVVAALLATGWCHPRSDEPWHFSYGGCG
jgi:hypothetical protein